MKTQFWICALLALFVTSVAADQAVISWTAPTERTDGTPLTVDEISGYDVFIDGELSTTVPGDATGATVDLASGKHCVTVQTIDTSNRRSVDSVCRDFKAAPNPVVITITVIVP